MSGFKSGRYSSFKSKLLCNNCRFDMLQEVPRRRLLLISIATSKIIVYYLDAGVVSNGSRNQRMDGSP